MFFSSILYRSHSLSSYIIDFVKISDTVDRKWMIEKSINMQVLDLNVARLPS